MAYSDRSVNSVFIIGCGDIGQRVAALWQARGVCVSALTHTRGKGPRLESQHITPFFGDLDDAATLANLSVHRQLVYYFAPPAPEGKTDPRMHNFLTTLNPNNQPHRIVYISTSGVYGDSKGAWVDEDTPPRPNSDRSRRRLDAESVLQKWAGKRNDALVILRVPGIYGPGRLPVQTLRAGLPVLREEECGFTNRIHAEDLARVCLAAGELQHLSSRIYNVSDGHPTTMTDYFYRVADLLGMERPPAVSRREAEKVLSAAMLSYLNESRRIDNRKMLRELNLELIYPTLESGLAVCTEPDTSA